MTKLVQTIFKEGSLPLSLHYNIVVHFDISMQNIQRLPPTHSSAAGF